MSAFAAVASLDGKPVDRDLLERMSNCLAFRGPDGQRVTTGGWNSNVGLVHARFATTHESEREVQPLRLGSGRIWISGHVRVDDRENLWRELEGAGRRDIRDATDAELVLHAYASWGDSFLRHLLGDFSFALWDETSRQMLCARDQMGVRPCYYHWSNRLLLASNLLACVLLHPDVPAEVSEEALLDYLLFGENTNLGTTLYRGVQRLPPGHRLVADGNGLSLARYWSLPVDEPRYLRSDAEYGEGLREVIQRAVSDRLRTDRVGVFMSGGIDSSTLAGVASRTYDVPANHVVAHTILVKGHVPDDERRYVNLIADRFGIEVQYREKGSGFYDPRWQDRHLACPEPYYQQFSHRDEVEHYRQVAEGCRVVFWGEGPDNALEFEPQKHVRALWNQGRIPRLLADLGKYLHYNPRLPRWRNISAALRPRGRGPNTAHDAFPAWIRPEIVKAYNLRDRWREVYLAIGADHPTKPKAYKWLTNHAFPNLCERFEPSWLGARLEFRHPYLDLRVLRFFFSLPVVPWCHDKLVMRLAARDLLPEECLRRPKTPVQGNPWVSALKDAPVPPFLTGDLLGRYVLLRQVALKQQGTVWGYALAQNVYAVDYWLHWRGLGILNP